MVHLHITEEQQKWLKYLVRNGVLYCYDNAEAVKQGDNLLELIEKARNPAKEVPMSIAQWHEEYEG